MYINVATVHLPIAFDVSLPCFLEEGVLINVTIRWSQFQLNGELISRCYDLQIFRNCTPDSTISNNSTTGVCLL